MVTLHFDFSQKKRYAVKLKKLWFFAIDSG